MEDAVAALTGVGELVVLFRADLADPEDAVRMAEWIRTHLAGSGVASVTVGVGSPAPEPGLLQNSYRDAVKALRAGLYSLGGNRVLLFSEVAERFHDTVSLEHLRMENDLAHHVTRGDVEKATAAAETIFDGMISSGAGVAELRLRLTELITILSRAAVAGNVDPGIAITWSGRLKLEVQGCSTPDALRSLLRQAATTFAGMVADVYRPATTRMIQRAIDYMRERYAEPISVRDVAGMLYLNTSYFCRAFKQVTGRTFGEYLTELRMEKALELLHASDLSIAAVAREVGYRDANYFSRVFTRIMGKTPSRYRQELQRRTCLVG